MIKTILFNLVFLFAVLQVTIACECGIPPQVARVYNGKPVKTHKYPWMALIRTYDDACGGTLIDNQHIITAAHCVHSRGFPMRRFAFNVYLGALELSSLNKALDVSEIWFDPDYDEEMLTNDLAILTLEKPVTFSPSIYPICLPNSEENLSKLIVAGWGRTNATAPASNELLEVDVDFLPLDECEKRKDKYWHDEAVIPEEYQPFEPPPLAKTVMCAVNKETLGETCNGDSGGPLMHVGPTGRHYLMGTVSGSWAPCGTYKNTGSLFTRINLYKETILENAPNSCWKDL